MSHRKTWLSFALVSLLMGCGEDRDLCEQLFEKQLRLVGEQSDVPDDLRDQAVAQLRDAKATVIELCRESVANDGAAADRALQCVLAARNLEAMRECEPPPTMVASAGRTGLAGPKPTRTRTHEPPMEAERPPPPPEPPRTVMDPELGRIEVK